MNRQSSTKHRAKTPDSTPPEDSTLLPSKSLGVRLLKSEAQQLEEIAERHHTTTSQLLKWAITSFVEYYEKTGQWLDVPALRALLKQPAEPQKIAYTPAGLPSAKVAEDHH